MERKEVEKVIMDKLDLKKEFKEFYNPSKKEVSSVDVPEMNFLMIDGKENPNTSKEYEQALEVLYGLSYTLKFACKEIEKDFAVMSLEGLWWSDDTNSFIEGNKDLWKWTAMIMQPEFVTAEMLIKAKINLKKKKLKIKQDGSKKYKMNLLKLEKSQIPKKERQH